MYYQFNGRRIDFDLLRILVLWAIYSLTGLLINLLYFHSISFQVAFSLIVLFIVALHDWLVAVGQLIFMKLFKTSYLARERMLFSLKESLSIEVPFAQLSRKLLETLSEVLQSRYLILLVESDRGYTLTSSIGFDYSLGNKITFLESHPVIKKLKEIDRPEAIELEITQEVFLFDDRDIEKPERMFAIPLKSGSSLLGGILTSELPAEFIKYWYNRGIKNLMEHLALIIENDYLYHSLDQEIQHKELLLSLNRKISAQIHLDDVLETLLQEMYRIVPYHAAGVFIRSSSTEKLRYLRVKGYDTRVLEQVRLKAGHGIVNWCMQHGLPRIVSDVRLEPQYFAIREGTRSEICVPIFGSDGVIGALNLEHDQVGYYGFDDLNLLESVADLASIAIQNARLLNEALESREVKNDIEVAASIQRAIMPRSFPEIRGFELAATYIPSRGISGDFYDFVTFSSGDFGFTIGDVSGKGIPASILMATIFAFYRNAIRSGKPLSEIFALLNRDLYEATSDDRFSTLFYARINPETLDLHYVNAGHNPPIIFHADDNLSYLTTGGPVLGVIPNAHYQEGYIKLKTGDLIVAYTDGVTEAFDEMWMEFGEKRLIDVVNKNKGKSAPEITNYITRAVREFSASEHFNDDLTLVIIKVKGSSS